MAFQLVAHAPEHINIESYSPSSVIYATIMSMAETRGFLPEGEEDLFFRSDGQLVSKELTKHCIALTQESITTHKEPWSTFYEQKMFDFLHWLELVQEYGFFIK